MNKVIHYILTTDQAPVGRLVTVRKSPGQWAILQHRQWTDADLIRLYSFLLPRSIEDLRDGAALVCKGGLESLTWTTRVDQGTIFVQGFGRLQDITLDQIVLAMDGLDHPLPS